MASRPDPAGEGEVPPAEGGRACRLARGRQQGPRDVRELIRDPLPKIGPQAGALSHVLRELATVMSFTTPALCSTACSARMAVRSSSWIRGLVQRAAEQRMPPGCLTPARHTRRQGSAACAGACRAYLLPFCGSPSVGSAVQPGSEGSCAPLRGPSSGSATRPLRGRRPPRDIDRRGHW